MHATRGLTLVEILVVLALLAIATLIALPATGTLRERGRTEAGAREMALLLQADRWKAVAVRRSRGLWFERRGESWIWWEVEDGNGNGLRTAEVRDGTDRILSGPHRLEDLVPEVTLGFPPGGPFPEIPPTPGNIADTMDPIQFGRSDVVSFSPTGSASSGTLYVTDRRRGLGAVVLFGPTARVRVWRLDPITGRWTL